MYSPIVVDHFRSPRNAGMMRDPDAVGESEDKNCGDLARFYLRVESGRITEARFQTYGCGPSIAASSLATELVRGRPLTFLEGLAAADVEQALGGLPADRRHAASVVVEALKVAAARYRDGRPREVSRV